MQKGGITMKAVVNMSQEQRQFLKGLLSDTKENFKKAFLDLANSPSKKDQRKFVAYWTTLAELACRKNVYTDKEQKGGTL